MEDENPEVKDLLDKVVSVFVVLFTFHPRFVRVYSCVRIYLPAFRVGRYRKPVKVGWQKCYRKQRRPKRN